MAVKKNYSRTLTVQLADEWYDRVKAVADHEFVGVSMAQVVRDVILAALPAFELQLGILVDDDDDEAVAEQIRQAQQAEEPKEDRTAGLAWGPPKPE